MLTQTTDGPMPLGLLLEEMRLTARALADARMVVPIDDVRSERLRRDLVELGGLLLPYTAPRLTATVATVETSPTPTNADEARERIRDRIERLTQSLPLDVADRHAD